MGGSKRGELVDRIGGGICEQLRRSLHAPVARVSWCSSPAMLDALPEEERKRASFADAVTKDLEQE